MTERTIKATWIGPFVGERGRQQLIPGETVVDVPESEARNSTNWQPVEAPAPPASKKKASD